jgi:hypothetical protein
MKVIVTFLKFIMTTYPTIVVFANFFNFYHYLCLEKLSVKSLA